MNFQRGALHPVHTKVDIERLVAADDRDGAAARCAAAGVDAEGDDALRPGLVGHRDDIAVALSAVGRRPERMDLAAGSGIYAVLVAGVGEEAAHRFFVEASVTREPGRGPPRHAHGDLTSLAPHERLPEILVVPREKTPTGAAARGNP